MTGWDAVAAQLESRLNEAEELLDLGDATEFDEFSLPDQPEAAPTVAQQARLEVISTRLGEIERRMSEELSRLGGEIAGSARKRDAGTAYRQGSSLHS